MTTMTKEPNIPDSPNEMSENAERIIKKRKELSGELLKRKKEVDKLLQSVVNLSGESEIYSMLCQDVDFVKTYSSLKTEVKAFSSLLRDKAQLYSNGTVTISFAGMEASGKTTLLNTLAGLNLPTSQAARCTAVTCEICDTSGDECFEVFYYSKEELFAMVNGQIKHLNERLNDARRLPEVSSLSDIMRLRLPSDDELTTAGIGNCKGVRDQLGALKCSLSEPDVVNLLGQMVSVPLNEQTLRAYVAHKEVGVGGQVVFEPYRTQPIVRIVRVHKKLAVGLNHLRLYDTPGVDDVNPIAREKTVQAAKSETDLMIIVSKIANRPEVSGPLTDFVSTLEGTAYDLLKRTFFLINRDISRSEKDHELYRSRLRDNWEGQIGILECNAMDPESVREFQIQVYNKLLEIIPVQDESLKNDIDTKWNTIISLVEKIIKYLKELQSSNDSIAIQNKQEAMYAAWFDRRNDPSSTGNHQDHFIQKLRALLSKMANESTDSQAAIDAIMTKVRDTRAAAWEEVSTWLKEEASKERCQEMVTAGDTPDRDLMPSLAALMSQTVNKIAKHAEEIGPEVQKLICDNIAEALDVGYQKDSQCKPSKELMCGVSPADRLNTLCEKLENSGDQAVRFIVENIKEIAAISARAGYIMRYELRPALNLVDLFQWSEGRRGQRSKKVFDILAEAANEDPYLMKAYIAKSIPSYQSTRDSNAEQTSRGTMCASSEVLQRIRTLFSQPNGYMFKKLEEWKKDAPDLFEHGYDARVLCARWICNATLLNNLSGSEKYSEFYHMLAYTTLITIDAILDSNVNRFKLLKEDFLLDACQTLATQKDSYTGWLSALRRHKETLCGEPCRSLGRGIKVGTKCQTWIDTFKSPNRNS